MSDKPIAVGDLVSVVRSCCSYQSARVVGQTSTVKAIFVGQTACIGCGQINRQLHASANNVRRAGIPLPWLQRIDPAAKKETVETELEMTA